MPRILAVADEVDESLGGETLAQLRPDLMLSAGDLPFDYLEYLVTVLNVPLLYVPEPRPESPLAARGAGLAAEHRAEGRPRSRRGPSGARTWMGGSRTWPASGWPVSAGASGIERVRTSTHRRRCEDGLAGCAAGRR